jgi:hypothetical protein
VGDASPSERWFVKLCKGEHLDLAGVKSFDGKYARFYASVNSDNKELTIVIVVGQQILRSMAWWQVNLVKVNYFCGMG